MRRRSFFGALSAAIAALVGFKSKAGGPTGIETDGHSQLKRDDPRVAHIGCTNGRLSFAEEGGNMPYGQVLPARCASRELGMWGRAVDRNAWKLSERDVTGGRRIAIVYSRDEAERWVLDDPLNQFCGDVEQERRAIRHRELARETMERYGLLRRLA